MLSRVAILTVGMVALWFVAHATEVTAQTKQAEVRSCYTSPPSIEQGNSVNLYANVRNNSAGDSGADLYVKFDIYNPSGSKIKTYTTDSQYVSRGNTYTFSLSYSPGSSASTGTYTVVCNLWWEKSNDEQLDYTGPGRTSNGRFTVTKPPTPTPVPAPTEKPDLVVRDVTVDHDSSLSRFEVGDRVRIRASVGNIGQDSAGRSRLAYSIGNHPSRLSSVGYDSVASLDPNESGDVSIYYTFTSSDIGTKYFVLDADYESDVSESDESNNRTTIGPFTVAAPPPEEPPTPTALPNLTMLSVNSWINSSHAGMCWRGETIRFTQVIQVTVNNGGTGRSGPFSVDYGRGAERLSGGLDPGSSWQFEVEYTVSGGAGPYGGSIQVDVHNEVTESNEYDNSISFSVPIPTPPPTCTPTPMPTPDTPTPIPDAPEVTLHTDNPTIKTGQPVDISLAVLNIGSNPELDVGVVLTAPTGLSLSGNDACGSPGLCSAVYELGGGKQASMQLQATASHAGDFTLEASVTWRVGDGSPAAQTASLKLTAVDPLKGETDVTVQIDRTKVTVGQQVRVQLAASNSLVKPPMTLKFVLEAPSGWSISGTAFADACAGQCIATYTVGSGELKNVNVAMQPNEPGKFEVEARTEWFFGNDTTTLETRTETITITVAGEPTPTPVVTPTPTSTPEPPPPLPKLPWRDIIIVLGVIVGSLTLLVAWMQLRKR